MYKLFLFSGGVYRFDELVELVEDMGGMVLKKDHFELSRGEYFLSEEIHVLLVVPEKEGKITESLAKEIKGQFKELKTTDEQRNSFLSYLSIYDCLCRAGKWIRKENLEALINCSCYARECSKFDDGYCPLDNLDEILMDMCSLELIEYRTFDGNVEYRLK